MTVLPALQAELSSATDQLLATAASFSDADIAAPSLLPGWTRGHVPAHLAKNAGSHVNLLTWARTGVRTPQYASFETRTAGIEATAAQPAARHLADLEEGAARLAAAVRDLPEEAWTAQVVLRDRPEAGGEIIGSLPGLGSGPAVEGTPADMLAWLTGRSGGEGVSLVPVGQSFMPGPGGTGLPEPPPWLMMPAPADLPATPPEDYPSSAPGSEGPGLPWSRTFAPWPRGGPA
ncbi:maleylpyruvate isomerase N-terminal domain-containing protein [Nonomuraea basaltis]|uniref:maleylpyruvate isomerase N-terminal domain-containing protein n=1 Tax=Nonomuraea basaltis TaxID=2495887 RepID=UPI00110C6FD7|nr:maleylpyruvate isomerase N-terminal domain-containing protein [Nonomuraea basaltis]TMR94684.1 maleylpyruvate isomerase family mycothiol-dependent enzyme [Nonomuraea basaltis]